MESLKDQLIATISAGTVQGNCLAGLPCISNPLQLFSHCILCIWTAVIGDWEAEIPNQLILSLILSLTSSVKYTHWCCGITKLGKTLSSSLNHTPLPAWGAIYQNINYHVLSLTVQYCQTRKYCLVANWLFIEQYISVKVNFQFFPLVPPGKPVVTSSCLGTLLTNCLSIFMLVIRVGFSLSGFGPFFFLNDNNIIMILTSG